MLNWKRIGWKNLWPNQDNILAFEWTEWGKPRWCQYSWCLPVA